MTNIKLATDNRKAAAQRLAEIIGGTSRYTEAGRDHRRDLPLH